MKHHAFTLIEAMVALILAALIIGVVWNSMHLVSVGEGVADREAARALEEARAMELLLRDLRSASSSVTEQDGPRQGEKTFAFHRWTKVNERLENVAVVWRLQLDHRMSRRMGNDPETTFHFDPNMDRTQRPFKFKIEKISTARWTPEGTVAPPR